LNIFLSLFRRSKIDQSLTARVADLEARLGSQGLDLGVTRECVSAMYSKMTALQKEVALLNGKVNKLRESNRRLTVRALRIEINRDGRLPQIDSAELAKVVRDSAARSIATGFVPKQTVMNICGIDTPMVEVQEPGYAYRSLEQSRYTVADYFENHLPHWAVKHVTQQRLVARVNVLAEESNIKPLAVKTKARTMARSWPAWLLERAASWITLDKGGIAPAPARAAPSKEQRQAQFGDK